MLFCCTDQDGKAVTTEAPKEPPVPAEPVKEESAEQVPQQEAAKEEPAPPAPIEAAKENDALDPRTVADPAPPVRKSDGRSMGDLGRKSFNPCAADQLGLDILAGFRRKVFGILVFQALVIWGLAVAVAKIPLVDDRDLLASTKKTPEYTTDCIIVGAAWALAVAFLLVVGRLRYSWPCNVAALSIFTVVISIALGIMGGSNVFYGMALAFGAILGIALPSCVSCGGKMVEVFPVSMVMSLVVFVIGIVIWLTVFDDISGAWVIPVLLLNSVGMMWVGYGMDCSCARLNPDEYILPVILVWSEVLTLAFIALLGVIGVGDGACNNSDCFATGVPYVLCDWWIYAGGDTPKRRHLKKLEAAEAAAPKQDAVAEDAGKQEVAQDAGDQNVEAAVTIKSTKSIFFRFTLRRDMWKHPKYAKDYEALLATMKNKDALTFVQVLRTSLSVLVFFLIPAGLIMSTGVFLALVPPLGHPAATTTTLIVNSLLTGLATSFLFKVAQHFDDEETNKANAICCVGEFIVVAFGFCFVRMVMVNIAPDLSYIVGTLIDLVSLIVYLLLPIFFFWIRDHYGRTLKGFIEYVIFVIVLAIYCYVWLGALVLNNMILPDSSITWIIPITITVCKMILRLIGNLMVRLLPDKPVSNFLIWVLHFLQDGQMLSALGVSQCVTFRDFGIFMGLDIVLFTLQLRTLRKIINTSNSREEPLSVQQWLGKNPAIRFFKAYTFFGSDVAQFKFRVTEMVFLNMCFESVGQTTMTVTMAIFFAWAHPIVKTSVSKDHLYSVMFPGEEFALLCISIFFVVTFLEDVIVTYFVSTRGYQMKPIWDCLMAPVRYGNVVASLPASLWLYELVVLIYMYLGENKTN